MTFLGKNKQFLNKNISHGSIVTHLWYGGMFHNDFIANLPLSLSVKNFENRPTFGEVTNKSIVACFLTHSVVQYCGSVPLKLSSLDTLPVVASAFRSHRRSIGKYCRPGRHVHFRNNRP